MVVKFILFIFFHLVIVLFRNNLPNEKNSYSVAYAQSYTQGNYNNQSDSVQLDVPTNWDEELLYLLNEWKKENTFDLKTISSIIASFGASLISSQLPIISEIIKLFETNDPNKTDISEEEFLLNFSSLKSEQKEKMIVHFREIFKGENTNGKLNIDDNNKSLTDGHFDDNEKENTDENVEKSDLSKRKDEQNNENVDSSSSRNNNPNHEEMEEKEIIDTLSKMSELYKKLNGDSHNIIKNKSDGSKIENADAGVTVFGNDENGQSNSNRQGRSGRTRGSGSGRTRGSGSGSGRYSANSYGCQSASDRELIFSLDPDNGRIPNEDRHARNLFYKALLNCSVEKRGSGPETIKCIEERLARHRKRMSHQCLRCFGQSVECAKSHCWMSCLFGTLCSDRCINCGVKHCQGDLTRCAGVPNLPTACPRS